MSDSIDNSISARQCGACAFYLKRYYESGECRKRAPAGVSRGNCTVIHELEPKWPMVTDDDWCGEWELRANKEAGQ